MKNRRILLIDDDDAIVEIVTFILQEAGYEIVSSTHSRILHDILHINPALILIDEWLEDTSRGSDACRALKSDPATSSIPVLLFSALPNIEIISDTVSADGYIKKPFDVNDLLLTIERFM